MNIVKGRVLRRVLNRITDLISGALTLDNYTIGLARDDDTLVARDDVGGFHYFMGSMAVESLIVDLTYAKEPVATYALLPAGDDDGSMRVVLSENTLYIKSNGAWFKSDIVAWNDILDKPLTFPPSPHQHEIADVSGLSDALSLLIPKDQIGVPNGVAELDETGKVLSSQLPSFVDDVLEFANLASFPSTGESGKIYVALDTNKTYRWSGTAYIEISSSLVLGETSSTAYRGDRGKTAYDHSQATGNPHGTTIGTITGLDTALAAKFYGTVSNNRIPQGDSTGTNKLKNTSWETYFDGLQPVEDNKSDLGATPKRIKSFFAYTVDAVTEVIEAGLTLASKYSPFSHAVNDTRHGIASSTLYGHAKCSTTSPLMDGEASAGTLGALFSAYDHRHPTDTSREGAHARSNITAAIDFHTLGIGSYRIGGGTWHANNPGTAYNWGNLEVMQRASNERILIYVADVVPTSSSAGIWVESCFSGAWRGWSHLSSKEYADTIYALIGGDPSFASVTSTGSIIGNTVFSNGSIQATTSTKIGDVNTNASTTNYNVTGKSFITLTGGALTILNGGTAGTIYVIASADSQSKTIRFSKVGGGTVDITISNCNCLILFCVSSGIFAPNT